MTGRQIRVRPNQGESNDWITPKYIIDALGPFDLDPCASDTQPWPTASRHFTYADNGLALKWDGMVWLNPPYGPYAVKFVQLLAQHGNGIALLFARTETAWFQEWVFGKASGLLFLKGRIRFHRPDGTPSSSNGGAPSVLAAYGLAAAERLKACGLSGVHI